jgi:hypothetical protein
VRTIHPFPLQPRRNKKPPSPDLTEGNPSGTQAEKLSVSATILFDLLFCPEDGGDIPSGTPASPNYMAAKARTPRHSKSTPKYDCHGIQRNINYTDYEEC